jgi:two-component system chemotaxis sensor kinase CheA
VGRITLAARHEGSQIVVEIADDGRGIDVRALRDKALSSGMKTSADLTGMNRNELLSLAFLPGLSSAGSVSDVSGRGVGMDVVRTGVERLGGTVELRSQPGQGTVLVLKMPLTLAIIPSLVLASEGRRFAIPQANIEELVRLYDADVNDRIACVGDREVCRLRGQLVPVAHLAEVLRRPVPFDAATQAEITKTSSAARRECWRAAEARLAKGESSQCMITFAILRVGATRFALVLDDLLGIQEIVVKPIHRCLKHVSIYAGATVLGDGQVALILDALGLARHARVEFDGEPARATPHGGPPHDHREHLSLLLFACGADERFGVDLRRVRRIEQIERRQIERAAGQEYVTIEGRMTPVVRLDRVLSVSPTPDSDTMYLVLVHHAPAFGVLVSSVIDAGSYDLVLDRVTMPIRGVTASAVQGGHMTLLLDIDYIGRAIPVERGAA